jgi:hypothetical protein
MQFSLHRVWLLCRKQWAENQQLYVLGLLAMVGIIAATIVYDLSDSIGFSYSRQQTLLYFGMILTGTIFTTTILSQFNDKIKGIQALVLPVSVTEKITVVFIYSILAFPLIFLLIVYPLIITGHYMDTHVIGRINTLYSFTTDNDMTSFILTFLALQSFALLGSILFKRYVFVKSIVLAIVIFFGLQIINPIILKSMLKREPWIPVNADVEEIFYNERHEPISSQTSKVIVYPQVLTAYPFNSTQLGYNENRQYYRGEIYLNTDLTLRHNYNLIFSLLLYTGIVLLWIITWFRLKEKEL